MLSKSVRSIETAASTNGARRLMSSALRIVRPGLFVNGVDDFDHLVDEIIDLREAGSKQYERSVVAGEAFAEPQLARHVGVLEIERLERARTDALDVPAVEELVRNGIEQTEPVRTDRCRARQNGAVAMLHPVAVGPGQVIGQKRVGVAFVRRVLAEYVAAPRERSSGRLGRTRRAPRPFPCDGRPDGRPVSAATSAERKRAQRRTRSPRSDCPSSTEGWAL